MVVIYSYFDTISNASPKITEDYIILTRSEVYILFYVFLRFSLMNLGYLCTSLSVKHPDLTNV